MTLVIAKIDKSNIYIESDSRITDIKSIRSDPLAGLLKTFILHPFVCVSFSGNVDYAECILKSLIEEPLKDIDTLIQLLLDANINSEKNTDFIVATIFDRLPKLYKISDKKVVTNIESAWIGDHQGFEFFQNKFHSLNSEYTFVKRFRESFQAVIDNSNIPSIGDFHISTELDYQICPNHPVFLHSPNLEISVSEPQTIILKDEKWKPLHLGTTAGGSHGISYLRTVSPRYHGVAIHFTHGNFGILFCPQFNFRPIMIKDVNGIDFTNRLKRDFDVPVQGLIKKDCSTIKFIDTRFS